MIINRNCIIIGPSGSGKSSVGRLLSKILSMDFYDMDSMIEKKYGVSADWLLDIEGIKGLTERSLILTESLCTSKNIILSTNATSLLSVDMKSVILTFDIIVFLCASIEKQMKQYLYDVSKDQEQKRLAAIKFTKDLYDMYSDSADLIIDTDHKTVKGIVQLILDADLLS